MSKHILITGGAGFIGANLANRLLSAGRPVLIFDNLSRPGVERNLQWLVETHGDLFVEDLVNAFLLAQAKMERLSGDAFNIGGGPENTISLVELVDFISELSGESYGVEFADWRPADQLLRLRYGKIPFGDRLETGRRRPRGRRARVSVAARITRTPSRPARSGDGRLETSASHNPRGGSDERLTQKVWQGASAQQR